MPPPLPITEPPGPQDELAADATRWAAVNKPLGMSSAQVIRDCQTHFNPSALFSRLIQEQARVRAVESISERRKRSRAKHKDHKKKDHEDTLDPLATGVLI